LRRRAAGDDHPLAGSARDRGAVEVKRGRSATDRAIVLVKRTLGLAVGCAIAVCSPALGAKSIAPASLALRPSELPGFEGVTAEVKSTSSPAAGAEVLLEAGDGAKLKREGFEQAVVDEFGSEADGSAVSTGGVFRSAHGAGQLFDEAVSKARRETGSSPRFTVAAIPRSFGVRETIPSPSGSGQQLTTGVLFSTGRCYVEVATDFASTQASSTPTRVEGAAIAGATAVYRRIKPLCAKR